MSDTPVGTSAASTAAPHLFVAAESAAGLAAAPAEPWPSPETAAAQDLERRSSAVTLSDMEVFIFPESRGRPPRPPPPKTSSAALRQ